MDRTAALDLLAVVGMRLSAFADQGGVLLGVTATEARVITCLKEYGVQRLSVIAERLESSPRRMTQVADALECKGLVTREPDPADGRAKRMTLTVQGAALGEEIGTLRAAWSRQLFEELSDGEVADLGEALTRILCALPSDRRSSSAS